MSVITEEAYKAMEARAMEAEARAVEAEANVFRAAEAGNDLVKKLNETKAARDSLYQERHELKQSLDNKIALMVSHLIVLNQDFPGGETGLKYEQRQEVHSRLVHAHTMFKAVEAGTCTYLLPRSVLVHART